MKAVKKHIGEKWILLYIERWLKAPIQGTDGEIAANTKGTPQGGVISPLLANLFLHFVLDVCLAKHYRNVPFERYADDIVLHFPTESYAKRLLQSLENRFTVCHLQLNLSKTKIVYCKDKQRNVSYSEVSFTFLGYDFKPRPCKRWHGRIEYVFLPAIAKQAKKRFSEKLSLLGISRYTSRSIEEIANLINPILRGMVNYFGAYYKSELSILCSQVNLKLKKWALKKYKKRGILKWLQRLYITHRGLFFHWGMYKPTYFFG